MSIYSVLFLSHDELKDLTDFKISSAQIRWLTTHSYPFEVGASGKPKVLRSYVIDKLQASTVSPKQSEPNFDSIR